MISNTKKITFSQSKLLKYNSFFLRGSYCIYTSNKKIISIEAIIDKLLKSKNGIFIFENFMEKEISIIFINNLENSLVFNIENKFNFNKFNSILKTILLKKNLEKVYILDSNKISAKLEVPFENISSSKYEKIRKKAFLLRSKKAYILKDILISLILSLMFYGQNYYFERLTKEVNSVTRETINEIKTETRKIQKKTIKKLKLLKEMPDKIAYSYEEILNQGKRN